MLLAVAMGFAGENHHGYQRRPRGLVWQNGTKGVGMKPWDDTQLIRATAGMVGNCVAGVPAPLNPLVKQGLLLKPSQTIV